MKILPTLRQLRYLTEVIDRQEHLCSSVYNITNSVGRQVSDEDTGPECDPQTETTVDNG